MLSNLFYSTFFRNLICILSLVGISVWMMFDLELQVDFLFWDEMEYELAGLALFDKINRTWGPFYALWYKFLSVFQSDAIKLYYLNYRLTTLIPAIMLFLFLRRIKLSYFVSLLFSAGFLFSNVLFETWPKISHFCFLVIMLALLASTYLKNNFLKTLLFAATCLALSYARPEFYLAFLITIFYFVFLLIKERKTISKSLVPVLIVFVFFAVSVHKKMGVPLGNNDRIVFALVQHLAYNANTWNNLDADFWLTGNVTLLPLIDSDCEGLYGCMWANKELMIKHGFQNIFNYVKFTTSFISDIFIPKSVFYWHGWTKVFFVFLLLLHVLFYRQFDVSQLKRYQTEIVLLCILSFPAVFSSFVIYPRTHYIILQLPLYFLLIFVPLTGYKKSLSESKWDSVKYISIAILFLFLIKPNGSRFDHHDLFRKHKSLRNVKAIHLLRDLDIQAEVNVLDNDGGLHRMLTPNYSWVLAAQKDTTYDAWAEKKGVNMIYVTQHLTRDMRYSEDKEWNEFISNPEGFKRFDVNDFEEYLLVKEELLD